MRKHRQTAHPDRGAAIRRETIRDATRWLHKAALLAAMLLIPLSLLAEPRLALEGPLEQGGVVFGETTPGATVRLAGREVRVSPQGRFVLGFGRDAESPQHLVVKGPGGDTLERELEIAARDYDIQRIDGVPPETVTPPPDALERIRAEIRLVRKARQRDDARTDFTADFIWPVTGRISGVYGSQRVYNGEPRRPHYGIDIAAPAGRTVRAPAPGIVTVADSDMYYSGGTILLDHGHGLSSAFLHLQSVAVKKGERVEQGQPIGAVGAGGRATGPHLDWRVNWFDRRVDAAHLVGPMPEDN